MKTTWRVLGVLLSVWMIIPGLAFGQVPQLINYQGVLVDPATGQLKPDNTYTFTFSIYNVSSGGSAIWTESQSVPTTNGLYSVLLGSTTPLTPTILSGTEKYLGIKVGSDPEMTPRKRIVSVAYAYTSSSVSGASNIFPSDGNVGIGTTDPVNNLHVTDPITSAVIRLESSSIDNLAILRFAGGGNNKWEIRAYDELINGLRLGICGITGEQLSILQTGNIGISRSDPNYKLDVNGDINFTGSLYQNGSPFSGSSLWYQNGNDIYYNNGNVGIGTISPSEKLEVNGNISVLGKNNKIAGATSEVPLSIKTEQFGVGLSVEGIGGADDGYLTFYMDNLEYATIATINSEGFWGNIVLSPFGGNIGIGTQYQNPENILTIQQNSTTDPIADAWTTYSSKRWKTNIQSIDGALDKVNRLRGVSYDWKNNGKHDIGLIAEEVGEVIPEVVAYEENGKDAKSIDYARLVAVLIEANKELQKEIEQQQSTMDALVKRITILEKNNP